MATVTVNWVGDFGVIVCTAEDASDPIEFTRQQLIDWHGIDPQACGFIAEVSE